MEVGDLDLQGFRKLKFINKDDFPKTIFIYIAKEFILSFIVAFLFFFFIFFINQLLLLAEDILSKHVPFLDVVKIIIYSIPTIVALTFPFSSLVGSLMAIGRLSSDNEFLAFQASGIPALKLFIPVLILGIGFTIVSFIFNDYFLPLGNIQFGKLYRKILYSNPELELEEYSVKRFHDSVIIPGKISEKTIDNIVIIDVDDKKNKRIILANKAQLKEDVDNAGVLSLELDNVMTHISDNKKTNDFSYSFSDLMKYNLLLQDIAFSVKSLTPREMSSVDVLKIIEEKKVKYNLKINNHEELKALNQFELYNNYYSLLYESNNSRFNSSTKNIENSFNELKNIENKIIRDRSLQVHEIEFNKKFAIPFGCLVFVIFAFPVGLYSKRSGRTVGFGIGLFVSLVYWGILFAGHTFGYRVYFSPFLSMWMPNFIILSLGILFFILRFRR